MNYHIMIDDKFFNDLIEDIEKISPNGRNRFFVRNIHNAKIHVTHIKAEWIENINGAEFLTLLRSLTEKDKIFVHWYDLSIGKLMLKMDSKVPLYVAIMGGDFYGDPELYHRNWLFDRSTLKLFKAKYLYPPLWERSPKSLIKQLSERKEKLFECKKIFDIKTKTIQRINYLLVGEHMNGEIDVVKKIYKVKGVKHLPFIYNQNFDLASSLGNIPKKNTTVHIQIGNSGTYTNNHLDILEKLRRFLRQDIKISVPLAYGDPVYSSIIKEHYHSKFADKVEFSEKFMSRESYVRKLQEIDICIMYHNRSQALGNCITLLTLGKKLYLKTNNPLWSLFTTIGVLVFDAKTIGGISFKKFCEPLTQVEIQTNILHLRETFSEKKRLENLENLLR